MHLPAWGLISSALPESVHTPITVTTAKALGTVPPPGASCWQPRAKFSGSALVPLLGSTRLTCSLLSPQLKSEDFASLKQLVPLLDELSRLHPEPVVQELAADLSVSICTHRAFSTEAICTAACKALGRSVGGAAGQGSAGTPDGTPRPGAPPPQKFPRSHPGQPQGMDSVAKESSAAPCSPQSHLQALLSAAYSPDIPTRAAALRHLSRMIEQRDPGALETREKLLKVGRQSTLWGKAQRTAREWLGLALRGSPFLACLGDPSEDGGVPRASPCELCLVARRFNACRCFYPTTLRHIELGFQSPADFLFPGFPPDVRRVASMLS